MANLSVGPSPMFSTTALFRSVVSSSALMKTIQLQRMKVCWSSFILGLVVGVGASMYLASVLRGYDR
eukprot:scaffold1890_cov86-Skeletonema_dohrnii-CCMP3373.AAC.2